MSIMKFINNYSIYNGHVEKPHQTFLVEFEWPARFESKADKLEPHHVQ